MTRSMSYRIASVIVALGVAASGCGGKTDAPAGGKGPAGPGGAMPPAPVRVALAVSTSMPVELQGVGAVEAYNTVEVKAQVSGQLTEVRFKDGDRVQKDQVLFIIDQRPFEAALRQAEADLAKAQALAEQARATVVESKAKAKNADSTFARDKALLERGTISQEEFDNSHTDAASLRAAVGADEAAAKSSAEAVKSAQAAVENAKFTLDYCTVRSPIDGKTGSVLVQVGNIVKANDTQPLVVINQTRPIYVSFTLPEKNLGDVAQRMAQGGLEVQALIPSQESKPVNGTLSFIDNAVNQTTGTFRLKAVFPNDDDRLWPGQFVNTVLQVSILRDVTAVPSSAVQAGQNGTFVYVIKSDMTAESRPVTTGHSRGDQVVITEGVQPGEQVVVDGQLRLTPGAKTKIITDAGPAKSAESTG